MIIGIDGNEANVEHQVGVSVYTTHLLIYFQKQANSETQFKVYLREVPKDFLPKETEFFKYVVVTGKFLWSQIFLPLQLNLKKEIDVFFSPAHYAPRFCPVPLVVTIHDVAYFYYPQEFLKKDLYKLQKWTKYSIDQAEKIIAVSKATKKDVMKFYEVPEKKVTVVYNGFNKLENNKETDVLDRLQLQPSDYILYVGTLQPRKNITTLIRTFEKFHEVYPETKLVLAGKKGWLYDEIFAEVQQKSLTDSVIFAGYVPDEDIATLYKNALCFVLPSLYEGFGIPLLEAMSYDCPVISSMTSSLPEVGGDACLYFDPNNEKDLLADLKDMKENTSLRNEVIQKGRERVKHFSWEKCAEETLEIIKNTEKKS